ncbi:FAD-dependent monooxygenase [Nonomuraea sp. NPDC052129]|uniref:FAD-dependent monooxygenase n=1 Tax=Nonomuraea sp. NPDC052129 TaxID=3154651 RepID=UPI00342BBB72
MKCREYIFRARVARRWRAGPVFIVGDAAHVTPPFIGQGLCAGLRDAHNLAWKLAARLRGRLLPALAHSRTARRIVLDTGSPPLTPGPESSGAPPAAYEARSSRSSAAGPGRRIRTGRPVLGDRTAVVALPGTDLAAVPDALPSAWLTVDPEGGDGERFLARWLRNAGVAWVSVDPTA